MPRYAVIDNGVVVGVLAASTPPTIDVPLNRVFVDITEIPDIKGGESYQNGVFSPAASDDLTKRVAAIEVRVADIQKTRTPVPDKV